MRVFKQEFLYFDMEKCLNILSFVFMWCGGMQTERVKQVHQPNE